MLLELLFEFELLLEFELELLLEFELLFEFEFELLFELEFELLSELLFEFELLFELSMWPPFSNFFQKPLSPSSASAGTAKEVAMKATVAIFAMFFIGGVLPCEKQPSVTAQG